MHNGHLVNEFKARGAIFVGKLDDTLVRKVVGYLRMLGPDEVETVEVVRFGLLPQTPSGVSSARAPNLREVGL